MEAVPSSAVGDLRSRVPARDRSGSQHRARELGPGRQDGVLVDVGHDHRADGLGDPGAGHPHGRRGIAAAAGAAGVFRRRGRRRPSRRRHAGEVAPGLVEAGARDLRAGVRPRRGAARLPHAGVPRAPDVPGAVVGPVHGHRVPRRLRDAAVLGPHLHRSQGLHGRRGALYRLGSRLPRHPHV